MLADWFTLFAIVGIGFGALQGLGRIADHLAAIRNGLASIERSMGMVEASISN